MTSAIRYVKNTDVAEDLVQDTMLKLWSMHPELNRPVGPLMSVLIRNICIDYLRRHHNFCELEGIHIEEPLPDDACQERMKRMMMIIDNLPDSQQVILRLRHMQGMEMKDIAAIFGTNETNIRKILSRARTAVRNRFIKEQTE